MTAIFPTQYSTLCARALGQELARRYRFKSCSCRLFMRNVSDTYLLETGKTKYIFKLYRDRHRTEEEIRGEAALLNQLAESGARVSHAINDADGHQLQAFKAAEGKRWGLLFTYAEGQPESDPGPDKMRTLGREMARIHRITEGLTLPFHRRPYNLETTVIVPLQIIQPAFINLSEKYEYLQRTAEEVVRSISEPITKQYSYGYCHFDFMPKNFHFDKGGKITFFDFDFAGRGHLIYDITSLYAHYFLEIYYNRTAPDAARRALDTFLSAYSETRTISAAEIAAIREFGFTWWLFYLGFQHANYDDWSSLFFNERFISTRVDLMKRWMEEPLYIG